MEGGGDRRPVHCSQKGKRKQKAKKQIKHLSHLNDVPPQGHCQKPTHFLFLSENKMTEAYPVGFLSFFFFISFFFLFLFWGSLFFFFLHLQHRKQNGQKMWGKAKKAFSLSCQTLERSKQMKIIIIIILKQDIMK